MDEELINLSSLREVLEQFDWYREKLRTSIEFLRESTTPNKLIEPEQIRNEVVKHWGGIISTLPLDRQQDRRFQNMLTVSLENYILHELHFIVFPALCAKHEEEDKRIWNICRNLARSNISAEQLSIPQGYSICFPAAVVELAALDEQSCPLDKLNCLRTTLDLLEADVKCAIADLHTQSTGDLNAPLLEPKDTIPMLAAVLLQAKPLHFSSNLYYIEKYQQTLTPHDPLYFSLMSFHAALHHLTNVKPEETTAHAEDHTNSLGRRLSKDISLKELQQLTNCFDKPSTSGTKKLEVAPTTPLDCHIGRIAGMIEASTRESNLDTFEDYSKNI